MVHRLQLLNEPERIPFIQQKVISNFSVISGTILQAQQTTPLITAHRTLMARWGLIPSSARNDFQSINRLSAEASSIGYSSTYRLVVRKNRALLPIQSYFFTHQSQGKSWMNKVERKEGLCWLVPVVYDQWVNHHQQEIISFALIHHTIRTDDRTMKLPLHLSSREAVDQWFDVSFHPKNLSQHLPTLEDYYWSTDPSEIQMSQTPTHFAVPKNRHIA